MNRQTYKNGKDLVDRYLIDGVTLGSLVSQCIVTFRS